MLANIDLAYQRVLGRDADSHGKQEWGKLNLTQDGLEQKLFESVEHKLQKAYEKKNGQFAGLETLNELFGRLSTGSEAEISAVVDGRPTPRIVNAQPPTDTPARNPANAEIQPAVADPKAPAVNPVQNANNIPRQPAGGIRPFQGESDQPLLSNADFIKELYLYYLRRLPSEEDVAFWERKIQNVTPRSTIIRDFLESPEHKAFEEKLRSGPQGNLIRKLDILTSYGGAGIYLDRVARGLGMTLDEFLNSAEGRRVLAARGITSEEVRAGIAAGWKRARTFV